MAEVQQEARGRVVEARTFILPVAPDAVVAEAKRFQKDTLVLEHELPLYEKLEEMRQHAQALTALLDQMSNQLLSPYVSYPSLATPPASINVAVKNYLLSALLTARNIISEFSAIASSYVSGSMDRGVSPQEVIYSIRNFDQQVDTLVNTVIILAQRILNTQSRNLPPTLRSALTVEGIGRMIITPR